MSSICKTPVSTGSTCKTATSTGSTCKNATSTGSTCKAATPVYGVNPELQVTAATDYDATSTYEGVISPASKVYTLKNIGDGPMDWSVSADQAWVDFDATSGTLLPGEEVEVTVTIDNALLFGVNTATILVTNDTDGTGDTTRGVELTVTGTLALTLEGRTLASSATMIGFSEFVGHASTPPKKYLRLSNSGDHIICYRNGMDCGAALILTDCYDYNVADIVYDVNTGLPNAVTLNQYYQTPGSCSFSTGGGVRATYPMSQRSATSLAGATITITSTTYARSGDGTCVAAAPNHYYVHGSSLQTLSDEDTEEDAVARMVAAGSWGAWGATSTQGDNKSSAATRAAFTFNSTAAQYRGTRTGLAPSRLFNGQVTLYRRAVGSADPWVEVSTLTFSATTDGSGNFSYSSNNLPTVTGYEYCVFNAVLTS